MAEFREAAEEYGVPVGLLMAMGWVNTRWEMPPDANRYEEEPARLGLLRDHVAWCRTLLRHPGRSLQAHGNPEEELKTNRAVQTSGAAVLLASAAGTQKPSRLLASGRRTGRRGASGQQLPCGRWDRERRTYAEQVFDDALQRGIPQEKLKSGERLSLEAQS